MSPQGTVTAAEIIRLYRGEKLSMQAVAARTGIPRREVREIIAGAGARRPGGGGRRETVISPERAAAIIEACTTGGLTQLQAAARFRIEKRTVARVLREQGGILPPAEAAVLAGIRPDRLRYLARAGAIRHTTCAGDGRRMYFRDDMLALAAGDRLLDALRRVWDGVYQITEAADGRLEAWRLDGTASMLADTAEELRGLLREDYPKYATGAVL